MIIALSPSLARWIRNCERIQARAVGRQLQIKVLIGNFFVKGFESMAIDARPSPRDHGKGDRMACRENCLCLGGQ